MTWDRIKRAAGFESDRAVAKAANVAVSVVSESINGHHTPNYATLRRLVDVLQGPARPVTAEMIMEAWRQERESKLTGKGGDGGGQAVTADATAGGGPAAG